QADQPHVDPEGLGEATADASEDAPGPASEADAAQGVEESSHGFHGTQWPRPPHRGWPPDSNAGNRKHPRSTPPCLPWTRERRVQGTGIIDAETTRDEDVRRR